MQTHQHGRNPACLAGLLATTLAASAAVLPLATPPPADYADTESSTNIPLQAWRDYMPPARLTLRLNATATNAVQVAFGRDLDGDADLQPEETEFVLGCDCGTWFTRNERTGETSVSPALPATNGHQPAATTFDFRLAKDPADRWDLAKVTTRGRGDTAASIAAQLLKPHFHIVIR